MAVRIESLNEKKLRAELEEAGKLCGIRNRYIARRGDPAYGICRCDVEGKIS